MLPKRDPPQNKRPTQTESEGLEKNILSTGTGKKGRVAILIADKIDFKTKAIKRDTRGYFIKLKERIHQEDINIINIYAPNIGASKYIRKIFEDFQKEIDSNTLTVGDFNTPSQPWINLPNKISTGVLWN